MGDDFEKRCPPLVGGENGRNHLCPPLVSLKGAAESNQSGAPRALSGTHILQPQLAVAVDSLEL